MMSDDHIPRNEFIAFADSIVGSVASTNKKLDILTDNVNTLVVVTTESRADTKHLTREVENVQEDLNSFKKEQFEPVREDVQDLKTKASNNKLRWVFLIAVVLTAMNLGTWAYDTFKKPNVDLQNTQAIQTEVIIDGFNKLIQIMEDQNEKD